LLQICGKEEPVEIVLRRLQVYSFEADGDSSRQTIGSAVHHRAQSTRVNKTLTLSLSFPSSVNVKLYTGPSDDHRLLASES
jgi:hypothetical protein